MAVSVPNVVKVTGSGVTSVATSGVTTTTGSTFTVSSTADAGVTINTPTDSKSNVYGALGTSQTDDTNSFRLSVFYKENGAGGSSHTATVTYSASTYPTAYFSEVAGAATASYDSGSLAAATDNNGSPHDVTSGTFAQANNAVLSWIACDGGGTRAYSCSGFNVTQETDGGNYWTGAVGYKLVTATTAQLASWVESSTRGLMKIVAFKEAAGGGSVSGTISWTEANDTAALTGSATVSGAPSWTEANDTTTITGSLTVSSSASWTEASDTASIAGAATVSGAIAWTEANDSAAITGALTASGSVSWTEANDAAALTGTVGDTVAASLAWTEADDTASLTGALTVSGSAAWTESSDTASLAGEVIQPATGTIAWTEQNDAYALTGTVQSSAAPAPSPSGASGSVKIPRGWPFDQVPISARERKRKKRAEEWAREQEAITERPLAKPLARISRAPAVAPPRSTPISPATAVTPPTSRASKATAAAPRPQVVAIERAVEQALHRDPPEDPRIAIQKQELERLRIRRRKEEEAIIRAFLAIDGLN